MKTSFALAMTTAAASAWSSNYHVSVEEVAQITLGVLKGAIEAEASLSDLQACIKDAETLGSEIEITYGDFKTESFNGVKNGIVEVGTIVGQITGDIKDCVAGVHDIENLIHMCESFQNPWSFAYHVGKDLLVNGIQIYHEVDDAIAQYESANWEGFGEDIGKALAQVFIGEQKPTYGLSANEVELVLLGIIQGALEQTLPDFSTCLSDMEKTASQVEEAIADFKKENISGVKSGIEMIGTIVQQLSTDLTDCEKIVADTTKLEDMAKTFKSPWSFAYHVGKDLIVDGSDIFHEIEESITNYDAGQYYEFGEDVGKALSLVLVGENSEENFIQ